MCIKNGYFFPCHVWFPEANCHLLWMLLFFGLVFGPHAGPWFLEAPLDARSMYAQTFGRHLPWKLLGSTGYLAMASMASLWHWLWIQAVSDIRMGALHLPRRVKKRRGQSCFTWCHPTTTCSPTTLSSHRKRSETSYDSKLWVMKRARLQHMGPHPDGSNLFFFVSWLSDAGDVSTKISLACNTHPLDESSCLFSPNPSETASFGPSPASLSSFVQKREPRTHCEFSTSWITYHHFSLSHHLPSQVGLTVLLRWRCAELRSALWTHRGHRILDLSCRGHRIHWGLHGCLVGCLGGLGGARLHDFQGFGGGTLGVQRKGDLSWKFTRFWSDGRGGYDILWRYLETPDTCWQLLFQIF